MSVFVQPSESFQVKNKFRHVNLVRKDTAEQNAVERNGVTSDYDRRLLRVNLPVALLKQTI